MISIYTDFKGIKMGGKAHAKINLKKKKNNASLTPPYERKTQLGIYPDGSAKQLLLG